MHFLLLAIGILLGIYGLYRFFLNANLRQIIALGMGAVFVVICAALFYLAVTGRLPAALGLLAALWPVALSIWHKKTQEPKPDAPDKPSSNTPMTRAEALEILGLTEDASAKDIKDAYTRLMKKVHPDQEGSKWMASKLNEAKALLLNHKTDGA
ncbi:MAG: DnaJ domain-containing protein [Rhodospirillales bacterium]|nr:DnaJ domain-containing protein [Rhodospirillales bacterium]